MARIGFDFAMVDWQQRREQHQEHINRRVLVNWVQACVSYEFWTYFMSEGRKRLQEYNREHDVNIEINKELTQKMSDERNLGLLND